MTDAMQRLAAAKAKADTTDSLRSLYRRTRAFLRDSMNWTDEEIAELDDVIRIDFADGPGVERPFAMDKEERIECWRGWCNAKLGVA